MISGYVDDVVVQSSAPNKLTYTINLSMIASILGIDNWDIPTRN